MEYRAFRGFEAVFAAAVLVIVVSVVYWPGLSGPFIFDDTHNIVDNRAIHVDQWDLEAIKEAAAAYGNRLPHRPVSTLSLALDYWLWDGEAFGFKVTNLVIHLINTLLVLVLAWQLLRSVSTQSGQSWPMWVAFVLAGVWAVHPLQVSTVLYVVQRMEMLAITFILLSLLTYVRGRWLMLAGRAGGWRWLALAGVCAALALFSKETGVLAPLFMLALELVIFRFGSESKADARALKIGFVTIVSVYALVFLFWLVPRNFGPTAYALRFFTWDERLLTQLRVLPMYMWWTLVPITDHYLFYYDHFPVSKSWFQPVTTLLGGLFLVALVGLGWLVRKSAPLAALGIAWFFVAHALSSNLVPLELVFEHRNYFSLFAVLLAVVGLLQLVPVPRGKIPAVPAAIALIVGLGVIAAIRSATWGDEYNLTVHHRHVNPDSPRAGLDMAEIYLEYTDGYSASPFHPSARNEFERVAELPRASMMADQALIVMYLRDEEEPPAEVWERLLGKAVENPLRPVDFDAIYNLVRLRSDGLPVDDDRLVELYDTLLERPEVPTQMHVRFGYYAALVLEDESMAATAFAQAERLLADSPQELEALRAALREAGVEINERDASVE